MLDELSHKISNYSLLISNISITVHMPFQYAYVIKDTVKGFLAEAVRKPLNLPQPGVSDRVPLLKVRHAHYADRKEGDALQPSDNNLQLSYELLAVEFDCLDH